ncbi:MAG: hypothetical protein V4726_08995 [Verrucomicrobiota bacterium]
MPAAATRRRFLTRLFFSATALGSGLSRAAGTEGLKLRVGTDGWGRASTAEVESVLRSAAAMLWPFFPNRRIEPFVVLRGHEGPIVHYQRNVIGEIVMKLDTQDLYWCQYAYQFAHEFCHILSGFNDDWKGNNWFEETMCETASLFVLRRLAREWEEHPPYPVWKSYAPQFRQYAEDVMDSRSQVGAGHLGDFFRKHRKELESTPRDRALNGAMAVVLLGVVEGSPSSWEAVSWLNSSPSLPGETFPAYLQKWHAAVPPRHHAFVEEIMRRFDLPPPAAAAPTASPASRNSAD